MMLSALLPAVSLPALVIAGFLMPRFLWQRDADACGNIPPDPNPPYPLTPAEAGTLLLDRCDMRDIVSTLAFLGARGIVSLHRETWHDRNGKPQIDYRILRHDQDDYDVSAPVFAHEQKLLTAIFGATRRERRIGELHGLFREQVPRLQYAVYNQLLRRGLITRNPVPIRWAVQGAAGTGFAYCTHAAGRALARSPDFWSAPLAPLGLGWIIGILLAFLAAFVMGGTIPAIRTREGVRYLRRCRAFARFARTATPAQIAPLARDNPELLDYTLPFALALRVPTEWAARLATLPPGCLTPPTWHTTDDAGNAPFSPRRFVFELLRSLADMNDDLNAAPPRET